MRSPTPFRRSSLAAACVMCALGLGGCQPAGNVDGSTDGAPPDAVSDTVAPETGTDVAADRPSDVVADAGSDVMSGCAAPDGGPPVPDGGTCPTTPVDPINYALGGITNAVVLMNGDISNVGGPVGLLLPDVRFSPESAGAPAATVGSCVYFPSRSGTTARGMSDDINTGAVTITVGSRSVPFVYDNAMRLYSVDGDMLAMILTDNTPTTVSVAGMGMYPAGMATLRTPFSVPTCAWHGPLGSSTDPRLSLTTDTPVSWDPQPDPDGNLVAVLSLNRSDTGQHIVYCAVPACQGSMTVPASIAAMAFTAGDVLDAQLMFSRVTSIPPSGRTPPLNFVLRAFVYNSVTVN